MENGILVEVKNVATDGLEPLPEKVTVAKWHPNNINEYFFFDEFGFLNISEKKIQESYSDFTETMLHVYNNIKEIYLKIIQKVITEDDADEIDFPRVPAELVI
jgi:hypothetical protein